MIGVDGPLAQIALSAVSVVISGVVGGAVAGLVAVATIRVQIAWLRADVDHAHRRIDALEIDALEKHRRTTP